MLLGRGQWKSQGSRMGWGLISLQCGRARSIVSLTHTHTQYRKFTSHWSECLSRLILTHRFHYFCGNGLYSAILYQWKYAHMYLQLGRKSLSLWPPLRVRECEGPGTQQEYRKCHPLPTFIGQWLGHRAAVGLYLSHLDCIWVSPGQPSV